MTRLAEYLRSKGVGCICYYSSGNLEPLIPLFLEMGINAITPAECAAGMDAIDLDKKYGKDLMVIGNIARQAIMSGREAVREEVMRKVPYLMKRGGFVPAFDDMVMPDMTFENVRYCADLIKSIDP